MSVLFKNEIGYYISHSEHIRKMYNKVSTSDGNYNSYELIQDIFNIKYPYVKPKVKPQKRKNEEIVDEDLKLEVDYVKNRYKLFQVNIAECLLIDKNDDEQSRDTEMKNTEALVTAERIYKSSGTDNVESIIGENRETARCIKMISSEYVFPENCKFYCSNIININKHLKDEKFHLILLDPPWWNKYIRRKKIKTNNSYLMMYNDDLKKLPVEHLIRNDGIVVIWCTNAASHLDYLKNEILKKWNLKYITKWYWIKVTTTGEPVCNFSEPPGKQPFEQIVFASRCDKSYNNFPDRKLIVSVPSALHSHKPPLQEVLEKYIPNNAKCLEIFARYLLANWTSYGLEAIRFQHHSLYREATSENTQ